MWRLIKKRLLGLLERHYGQSEWDFTGCWEEIGDLNKVATLELGEGCHAPEGLREWLPGKNDVLSEDGQGLTDIELVKAFRTSNIVKI